MSFVYALLVFVAHAHLEKFWKTITILLLQAEAEKLIFASLRLRSLASFKAKLSLS